MKDYDGWKTVDIDYMNSCDDDIDLTSLFMKAFKALSKALSPLIQHFLDEGDTVKSLWNIRNWGDRLQSNFGKDVHCFHILTPILPDGSKASMDEWKSGKVASFDAIAIAWDEIYSLTNGLQDKYGNTYMKT